VPSLYAPVAVKIDVSLLAIISRLEVTAIDRNTTSGGGLFIGGMASEQAAKSTLTSAMRERRFIWAAA